MRTQRPFFVQFLAVLLVLLCGGVTANAEDLVEAEIPPMEHIYGEDALDMYLRPSLETANNATIDSNTLCGHAYDLDQDGKLLIQEREAARIAAFGPDDQWQGDLVDFVANVVTQNAVEPIKDFVKGLLGKSDKLAREQAYAEKCQEVNNHYVTVNDAKVMAESMHAIAGTLRERYKQQNTSPSGLRAFDPLPDITIPDPVSPRWRCKGNGFGTGLSESLLTCLDTYYFPVDAYWTHRIECGGRNDPNPSVAGCGNGYYTCKTGSGDTHAVKYCDNYIVYYPGGFSLPKRLGKCGAAYRDCPGSQSWSGTHGYEPVYSYNSGNKYASSYQSQTSSSHRGNRSKSSASFHGPTKYSESIRDKIDETPNCSTCIDGSSNCPNASNHSGGTASVSPGLAPASGSYTASAGDTHTASLSLPSAYSSIYLYVKSPSESGLGTSVSYVSGDGSSTSATLSYTFPSDASGDYVITAYTYLLDNSIVQPSYTVTVGSGSSTDTTTDNTPDCSYCTDGCSACPSDDGDDDSGTSQSNQLYSSDGNYTLYAGDTHNSTCMTSAPYSYVAWWVDDFLWETDDNPEGTSTEASFSYTFDDPGTYTIMVEIQIFNGSYSRESYTVTVQ